MIREHGNMWSIYEETDYFLVTTNSYIRADGELVMGRGMAKQAKSRFPELPQLLGNRIEHLRLYGLEIIELPGEKGWIGAFQVKRHFKYDAEVDIIKFSVGKLKTLAQLFSQARYDLNFPGIGNGRLTPPEVLGLLEPLPNNVHIWTYT